MPKPRDAALLSVGYRVVTIRCPYCGEEHEHHQLAHGKQWFAAGCGLYTPINRDQRAAGYRFYIERERR